MKRLFFLLSMISMPLVAQDILPLRERASLIDEIQKERIQNLLPQLMEEQDIDLWVMITREYNEGPCSQKPYCLLLGSMLVDVLYWCFQKQKRE